MGLLEITTKILDEEAHLKQGGNPERQRKLGRMTARERIVHLLDENAPFFELSLWAGWNMYTEWGPFPPAAGVVAGIGRVEGRETLIIANDATVKAGAMFPQSVKKMLRAQRIAFECRLPILYLVDSSGVFLPLQDEIFPDEDDFGRIFRNNALISAAGIPQFAAIMGNCIAGGGYLPVLCDELVMTEGSGLYLAGPALVKAAIGQEVEAEALGGAKMHASTSGTVDFLEKDDASCLKRLRSLVAMLPEDPAERRVDGGEGIYTLTNHPYDIRDLLQHIVDQDSLIEFKAEYGKTVVTAWARINGSKVGIIANQKIQTTTARGEVEIGGVLYADSADKAARFVMECNQARLPLIFFQDVVGFMVGQQAEESGIIRSGAKLVSAISNSIVPKITVIIGNSFGAGNYALCGKAYDPNFIIAWPNAKLAVMGSEQASNTLFSVTKDEVLKKRVKKSFEEQTDIRYAAARGFVDAIIAPHDTKRVLSHLLTLVERAPETCKTFHTGVYQV